MDVRRFACRVAGVVWLLLSLCLGAAAGEVSAAVGEPAGGVAPTIAGVALVGQTLTATAGQWQGARPLAFEYQWQLCDAGAGTCVPIPGATGQAYPLTAADAGAAIRVQVTATNADGSASMVSSATTPVAVSPPAAAARLEDGNFVLPVSEVVWPDRLLLSSVGIVPVRPAAGRPLGVRVRVTDAAGYLIQGAIVSAAALPFGLFASSAEAATDATGTASLTLEPTPLASLEPSLTPVLLVRADLPGEPLLASVSATTLLPLQLVRAVSAATTSPYRAAARGYDLSYPDCTRPRSSRPGFAILGVNGGRPFTFNPCLRHEHGWYGTAGPPAVYLNTGYDARLVREITPACALAAGRLARATARAYAIGCSEAATSLERITLLGLTPPALWWLDVETSNRWSSNRSLNSAAIRGIVDFLDKLVPAPIIGIYSRPSWWRAITGGWATANPEWIPTAGSACPAPFSNGPVWLAQTGSTALDLDTAC